MNLTSTDIEEDYYNLLKGSSFEMAISGKIYKSGMRPIGSKKEDVVISFLAGLSNQIQTGVVIINTYIPDNTQGLKDTARCKTLEAEIKSWIASIINQKYKVKLEKTIQVFAEPDIHQHFISTRLNFKLLIQ